jgi:hypothetical protein
LTTPWARVIEVRRVIEVLQEIAMDERQPRIARAQAAQLVLRYGYGLNVYGLPLAEAGGQKRSENRSPHLGTARKQWEM